MTTAHHTPITVGAAANAATINAPLGELDAAISAVSGGSGTAPFTAVNGAASAGQKVVTVDTTTMFFADCAVEYETADGVTERNLVDTVDSATQITLVSNIGAGGIADNAKVLLVSQGVYNAAAGVRNVMDYGAVPGGDATTNTTAIQAALDAAATGNGGIVEIPPGRYSIASVLTIPNGVWLRGKGSEEVPGSGYATELYTTAAITMLRSASVATPGETNYIRISNLELVSDGTATRGIDLAATGQLSTQVFLDHINIYYCQNGIRINGLSYGSLYNIQGRGYNTEGSYGLYLTDFGFNHVSNVSFGNYDIGLYLSAMGAVFQASAFWAEASCTNATNLAKLVDCYNATFINVNFENITSGLTLDEVLVTTSAASPSNHTMNNKFIGCMWNGTNTAGRRLVLGEAGVEAVNRTLIDACDFITAATDIAIDNAAQTTITPTTRTHGGYSATTSSAPTITGLSSEPLPIIERTIYDSFTRADGALGNTDAVLDTGTEARVRTWQFDSGIWTVSSNRADSAPALGSEKLSNGNMETGSPPTGWPATAATAASDADAHGGSAALKLSNTEAGGFAYQDSGSTIVGDWYLASAWCKCSTGAGQFRTNDSSVTYVDFIAVSGATYAQYHIVSRAPSTTTFGVLLYGTGASDVLLWDDISLKPLTLSELFTSVYSPWQDVDIAVNVTLAARTRTPAGLVLNLDDPTTPANFVIAYTEGRAVRLEKCVAGTYTSLINEVTTYADDATLRVVKAGTSYALYYNGVQVGTTQTIDDAGIIDNKNHGLFNTYTGATFGKFRVREA